MFDEQHDPIFSVLIEPFFQLDQLRLRNTKIATNVEVLIRLPGIDDVRGLTKPNRMIRNDFTRSWEGRESEIKPYPNQMIEVGNPASVRGRIEGDVVNGVLPAGQGAGIIDHVESGGDVVRQTMDQARAIFERWNQ